MKIEPSILHGVVRVPSSKSVGHRLLICAALADGESKIYDLSMSKDIKATMLALQAIGATFTLEKDEHDISFWQVRGISHSDGNKINISDENFQKEIIINCGESGSTLRFMIPVALTVADNLCFEGKGRLVERPINEFFPIFEKNQIQMVYDGKLPLKLKGKLKAGNYSISGKISSQYTTGLLLAAPLWGSQSEINICGDMESKGYIDLTLESMRLFGVNVFRDTWKRFELRANQCYLPTTVCVEGDFSQAAFWIVAGLIGKEHIKITGLNKSSVQGDRVILDFVTQMNGRLLWEDGNLLVYPSQTVGMIIDASQCPDLIPVMCVLAALSEGETRVVNGKRLRLKESDRICATVTELKKLGATIEETEDGMIVQGNETFIGGCKVEGWNDHRIVMAMAIASTRCELPIEINGCEAIEKSYPDFFKDFKELGGWIYGD